MQCFTRIWTTLPTVERQCNSHNIVSTNQEVSYHNKHHNSKLYFVGRLSFFVTSIGVILTVAVVVAASVVRQVANVDSGYAKYVWCNGAATGILQPQVAAGAVQIFQPVFSWWLVPILLVLLYCTLVSVCGVTPNIIYMFVTLRYGQNEGEEAQFVERSTKPPRQGSINPHFACNACRQQKAGPPLRPASLIDMLTLYSLDAAARRLDVHDVALAMRNATT